MYVCMYVCMHACMYVCMYVCTWLWYIAMFSSGSRSWSKPNMLFSSLSKSMEPSDPVAEEASEAAMAWVMCLDSHVCMHSGEEVTDT